MSGSGPKNSDISDQRPRVVWPGVVIYSFIPFDSGKELHDAGNDGVKAITRAVEGAKRAASAVFCGHSPVPSLVDDQFQNIRTGIMTDGIVLHLAGRG